MTTTPSEDQPDHLCVLIHGLWGNPEHLKYVAESLEERHEGKVLTLVCKSNSGTFTYDGVDVGGERAAREIRDHLKELEAEGRNIKKFSIVGYSLGGLVARYAIGILYHDGLFDKIEPVNFTTFATPHLGTRTPPLTLWSTHVFNLFGPRVISASGKQLFAADKFREFDKPLLEVMTDPENIFLQALEKFKTRTIYANIVNDRLAWFFTTAMSPIDPFTDNLDKLEYNYVDGYEPVIMDGKNPCQLPSSESPQEDVPWPSLMETAQASARKVATVCAVAVAAPIFITGFLTSSAIETYRSQRRIRLHLEKEGPTSYKISNMLQRMASNLEDRAGTIEHAARGIGRNPRRRSSTGSTKSKPSEVAPTWISQQKDKLPLLPSQFRMIESLDKVGFDKFPVWIHKSNWSHAAIVVRKPRPDFDEGKLVIKHWLDLQFQI